jgi:hypothetical protein
MIDRRVSKTVSQARYGVTPSQEKKAASASLKPACSSDSGKRWVSKSTGTNFIDRGGAMPADTSWLRFQAWVTG